MMTMHEQLPGIAPADATEGHLRGWLASLRTHVAAWVATCAAYYDAATTYERLSGLSNAELQRRGLSRETLARDICEACERRDQA